MLRRRDLGRLTLLIVTGLILRNFLTSTSSKDEIRGHNVLERVVSRSNSVLDVRKHPFLQAHIGRDEYDDFFNNVITNGADDYWERFQKPFTFNSETSHADEEAVRSAVDQLFAENGWVVGLCPRLIRPFGKTHNDNRYYEGIVERNQLYYVAIIIHSADHFLVDQLAVIIQLARRLGPQRLFVSMVDYGSTDSTATLLDLCEAVLILTGIPFRIRHIPSMTEDPSAAYYPLEEANTRNLALEPLKDLYERRAIKFHRVIWLKGFTCPNDILELIKVSDANEAAMVCGMDWAELNGNFIFSDRWRTRDISGDQFRQARSSSNPDASPLRDQSSATRFTAHLPFQVFCCESGTHVVDPSQSYYRGIQYRSAMNYHNLSTTQSAPKWDPQGACMDSAQSSFCRDLWIDAARDGMRNEQSRKGGMSWLDPDEQDDLEVPFEIKKGKSNIKRDGDDFAHEGEEPKWEALPGELGEDADTNAGSDYDAMPDSDMDVPELSSPPRLSIPNSAFRPARLLVNPRCVTTYAGVSHMKLARDLFGENDDDDDPKTEGKYTLDDWESAPDSFVCQEQRQTGGRRATKTQRRLGFSLHDEIERAY
ncbi:hypothetical protein Clacol_008550 [Clathrus columnatus]|uniref:Glycosyltransferase family 69 protein n=1 Tax=Clathrus columnatus TaxID=1419009 RepID=A0AAV5API5_9AGAM|nr:hypothetical protein Clacol_008550 [Clathrus columnatus]